MNDLVKYLVESIMEGESGITVLLPGGFKPPHGGHLDLAKRYASQPNVSQVLILIGPKEREGITRDQSMAVWKLLLAGTTNVKTLGVTEDNPLVAAYKYIETAKPGTYALAASNKGEDYVRVKKFVDGHAIGAKYNRNGVNVVELPLDTRPMYYKGRTDQLNGKGISASTLRKDLVNKDYINFKTNYPGTLDNTLKSVYSILTKTINERKSSKSSLSLPQLLKNIVIYEDEMAQWFGRDLLLCGGAAGHLAHPYEDYDLTFQDIENMIDAALGGTLEYAQEKLDGQNLMVTYKDGKVRAARNKGQVKNFAANSLTVKQVEDMFAGRGPIQAAFTEAMVDLETAINKLTPVQKQKFFANGRKFANLEVLYPETANVIPYGATQLRLHHIKEYDEAGNIVGEDVQAAHQLQGAIRQVKAENQKTYEIKTTDPITIAKSSDYKKQRDELIKGLTELKSKYGLKDTDKLGLYFQGWWSDFITNQAKQSGYKINPNTLQQLIERWAFGNKAVNIKDIRNGIESDEFRDWVMNFDKGELNDKKKIASKPVENLFLKLGVYTLRNVENLVALNPNESVSIIKKDLKNAISQIKAYAKSPDSQDNDVALKFLKRELTRLKDIGGFDAILPSEGLVFQYNGKLFKLTGAFAPINMILGYLKY
jgi:hypothetical protein